MTGESQPKYDPVAATSRYLVELLQQKPYRQLWERAAALRDRPARPGKLSQEAVRLVYVEHLKRTDQLNVDEQEQYTAERYERGTERKRLKKDKVNRVLTGDSLDEKTLLDFMAAFKISDSHAERLLMILKGDEAAPVAIGTLTRPAGLPPLRHETVMLVEEHHLGPAGTPVCHVSEQRIRALEDGLTHFPYRFNTNQISVRVMRGAIAGELTQVTDSVWEVPIRFRKPLHYGETKSFKFSSRFHYDRPPWTDFRRAVTGRLESLAIRVKFHRARVPVHVWWTEWEHHEDGSPIVRDETVELQDDLTVDRYLKYVEHAVVGFRWVW